MFMRCLVFATAGVLGLLRLAPAQTNGPVNLATNPGFEDTPDDNNPVPSWILFTTRINGVSLVASGQKSGTNCVSISAQRTSGQLQGLFQTLRVTGGETYSFSINVKSSREDPLGGAVYGLLVIEWKNSARKVLQIRRSTPWDSSLSTLRWQTVSLHGVRAPKDATEANFCVHLGEGGRGGHGTVLLDDVIITRDADHPRDAGD